MSGTSLGRLAISTAIVLFAQTGQAQQLPFCNYSVADGLANQVVRAVIQDADGFLWFGTERGVSRFDGVEFVTFRAEDGLASDWVSSMVMDRSGAIWFASSSAGVTRHAHGSFDRIGGAAGNGPGARTLLVDGDGTPWAGWRGLYRFDGNDFVRVEVSGETLPGVTFALFEDPTGRLWTGTEEGHQVVERTEDGLHQVARGGPYWVSCFARDPSGTIWMGTDRGLKHFPAGAPSDEPSAELPAGLEALADQWIRCVHVDASSALWIGTNALGVFHRSPDGRVDHYTVFNGLAGNAVLQIVQDREGNMWFATTTGISKLSTREFLNFTVRDGLVHNIAMCIVQDVAGDYWVGTAEGVSRISGGRVTVADDGFGLHDTFALFSIRDRMGQVWMGSELGASRLAGDRFVTFGPAQGWTDAPSGWNRGRTLWEDERDWIWFGNDWGLSVWKDGRFHTYSWPAEPDSLGCAVLTDLKGNVWLGFHSGWGILRLAVRDPGEGLAPELTLLAHYRAPDDIPDGRVVSRERDRDGNVWFGTRSAGALRFVLQGGEVERIDRFSTKEGLADDYVRTIFQDSRGNVWLGTDRGVDCLPPRVQGRTMFRHLGVEDGLPADVVQFCYEDDSGDLWFCTTNGVSRYRADPEPPPPVAPRVHITGFSVLGEPDPASLARSAATLPPARRSVAFQFAATVYRGARRPLYSYRLEGTDRDWSPPTTSRHVNYPLLPPGKYVFEVIAQNADGLWSAEPATFALEIEAPFWRRGWFLALAVVTVGGVSYGAHRARLRRILNVRAMRDRIAADLHDDVGSTLSSISILSEIGMRPGSDRDPELLRQIHRDSQEMMEAMDDIVWTIRPQADALEAMIERLRRFGCQILEPAGASFRFDVTDTRDRPLPAEVRRDVYLIFKEAVTNAARHAKCKSVRAQLEITARDLRLRVSDDGRGIPAGGSAGGNGMNNMARRAESIGGELHVGEEAGGGTRISLRVPLGRRRS